MLARCAIFLKGFIRLIRKINDFWKKFSNFWGKKFLKNIFFFTPYHPGGDSEKTYTPDRLIDQLRTESPGHDTTRFEDKRQKTTTKKLDTDLNMSDLFLQGYICIFKNNPQI